jgi:hypothetical protein
LWRFSLFLNKKLENFPPKISKFIQIYARKKIKKSSTLLCPRKGGKKNAMKKTLLMTIFAYLH